MKQYSLFISHSWSYGDAYAKLVKLLKAAPRFSYRNYCIPKTDPVHHAPTVALLMKAIEERVRFCDVVVILAGVYATYSKWITNEVHVAKGFSSPKPIIAVQPWDGERTSKTVKDNADRIVAWNTKSVVSAIRELSR